MRNRNELECKMLKVSYAILTGLLKPSELGLQHADFNKQSLNVALNYSERYWGFLLSNDFPLYLPHATGVETEVSYFPLFVFGPSIFCQ